MKRQSCYFLDEDETSCVEKVIQLPNGGLNPKIVGKKATEIARMAGIKVPTDTIVLISQQVGVGPKFPFSRESCAQRSDFIQRGVGAGV